VVVPTPQSTATANGQTRQIGALQIAIWALVGTAAFLLAYLLSGFVLSRKQ
jgi:type VI protein secretion system component VasF